MALPDDMLLQPAFAYLLRPLLAQGAQSGEGVSTILWSIAAVAIAAVVFAVIALWLRRKLLHSRDDQPMGVTINDLRRMRDAGHLTEEEFEATQAALQARRQANQSQADQAGAGDPAEDAASHHDATSDDDASAEDQSDAPPDDHDDDSDQPPSSKS
jgi:hypothetical protein